VSNPEQEDTDIMTGSITVSIPDGIYLKRVVPKTGEVDITNSEQADNLRNWFNK
jgi:hypothetical protein